ncbi:MAG: P-loop NTPase fold protein [Candidatus Thiodiazotropha sp.]
MTQEATKNAIIDALKTSNTPVIALTGEWGCGKTYLWKNTLAEKLTKDKIVTPIYISAVGVSTIDELKTVCATRLLSIASSPSGLDRITKYVSKHLDKLSIILPSTIQSNIADAFIFLPEIKRYLPNNILLVIDDIERAENIDVMQLLGLVNLLTDELEIRILLILNSDKLASNNKEKWEIIHEKLISREVKLSITSSEAVNIGLSDVTGAQYEILHNYIDKLEISNIRIIQHIKRVCESIVLNNTINDGVFDSLSRSIVLLTAIHFRSIDDWPSIDWLVKNTKHPTLDNNNSNEKHWKYKIDNYGLGYLDEFEFDILIPFLRTGHLNTSSLESYIKKTDQRIKSEKTYQIIEQLYLLEYWSPNRTTDQISTIIKKLIEHIEYIRPTDITGIANIANLHIDNGYEVLMNNWLETHEPIIKKIVFKEHDYDYIYNQHDIDSRVRQLLFDRNNDLYPTPGLMEAITYIETNNSYGQRYVEPTLSATKEDYIQLLKNADGMEMKFIARFVTSLLTSDIYDPNTKHRTDTIKQALIFIFSELPDSNLAKIWKRVVDENSINLE